MKSKFLFWLLITVLLGTVSAQAQQTGKAASLSLADAQAPSNVPRLGYLGAGAGPEGSFRRAALWRELNKLGYFEGKNIGSEIRSADNKPERLAALAEELVRLKVDVIYTGG